MSYEIPPAPRAAARTRDEGAVYFFFLHCALSVLCRSAGISDEGNSVLKEGVPDLSLQPSHDGEGACVMRGRWPLPRATHVPIVTRASSDISRRVM